MNGYEGLWGYIVLVLVGFLPADVWRVLGVMIGRGIDEESELLVWVRAVATAVLAGVIAKIIFFPPGSLAAMPLLRSDADLWRFCWCAGRSLPGSQPARSYWSRPGSSSRARSICRKVADFSDKSMRPRKC